MLFNIFKAASWLPTAYLEWASELTSTETPYSMQSDGFAVLIASGADYKGVGVDLD